MARILVQTDDCRTILEERDVRAVDLDDEVASVPLLGRIERALHEAHDTGARKRVRRLLSIVPAQDYREVHG